MAVEQLLQRVVVDARVMLGKPVIRGTRIPVELIVRLLGEGITTKELLEDYPQLTEEDIRAALLYAAKVLNNEDVFPSAPGET